MDHPASGYAQNIRQKFKLLFGQKPVLFQSPGRINLIGEHTDYNQGFVLPAAINKAVYLGIGKRDDKQIRLHSLDYHDDHQSDISCLNRSGKLWPDYILGVVEQIQKDHSLRQGFNIVFGGDIPLGAGLSSSAALECATAYALNYIFDLDYSKSVMAKIAQAAENQFVGVNCGIMDQFASLFGRKNHLIRLDCRDLEYEYIPFRVNGLKIVLFDSRVKHSLASSAYNERREQCESGVVILQRYHPEIKSLRDVNQDMLDIHVKGKDETVYRRCSYVVSENSRLLAGCEDLRNNDPLAFGRRMFETHAGLKDLYEVSCPELDLLIDLVRNKPAVAGARMMGGGFGGCTINLVKEEAAEELISYVSSAYLRETDTELLTYEVEIGDGTGLLL
jgi:galactokinase